MRARISFFSSTRSATAFWFLTPSKPWKKATKPSARSSAIYPKEKVRVEIAPDATSFNAISTLSLRDIEETGAVGICKFNKLMIISPRALSFGYRWVDSLSHEYLHYAIVALSNNQAPIWLHEGMARFYETRWRKAVPPKDAAEDYLTPANQTLLVQALEKNQFVGFKNMEPSLIHLDTPEQVQLAYAEAASAVDFINQSKGRAGIRELLATLNEKPTPEAIEKVYGMSFDAFETRWKGFLKTKGLKEIEGSRVRKLKVKKDQREDEEVVELKEIQSAVARNRTHLADQMLGKGRSAAAAARIPARPAGQPALADYSQQARTGYDRNEPLRRSPAAAEESPGCRSG